jgi:hypothetical protein
MEEWLNSKKTTISTNPTCKFFWGTGWVLIKQINLWDAVGFVS